MKKKHLLILLVFTIMSLSGCGAKIEQAADSLNIEQGSKLNINLEDYFTSNKPEVLSDFLIDTSDIDVNMVGTYNVTVAYKNERYNISVNVQDTTAPIITLKENLEGIDSNEISAIDLVEIADKSDCKVYFVKGNEEKEAIKFDSKTYDYELVAVDKGGNRSKAITKSEALEFILNNYKSQTSNNNSTFVLNSPLHPSTNITIQDGKYEYSIEFLASIQGINGVSDLNELALEAMLQEVGTILTEAKTEKEVIDCIEFYSGRYLDEQIQAEAPTLPGNYGTNPDGTPKDLVQYLLEQQQQGLSGSTDNSGNSGNSGSNNTGSTGSTGNSGNSGNTGNSGSNNTSNPEDDVTNYNPIAPEEEVIGDDWGFGDLSGITHGAGDGTHIGTGHTTEEKVIGDDWGFEDFSGGVHGEGDGTHIGTSHTTEEVIGDDWGFEDFSGGSHDPNATGGNLDTSR